MRNVWLIFARELGAYLKSPMGWVIAAAVLVIDGILFNAYAMGRGAKLSADVLRDFFYFSSGTTMVASVFLSMRLIAEERQMGTMVLLNTSPVREIEVVLGKFFSAFVFLSLLTLATVYMPFLVKVHGKISWGHVVVGYGGLLLLGSAALSMGVFASTLARSQIVAAVLGAAILIAMLLLWFVARVTDPPLKDFVAALALHAQNFRPFMEGVLHTKNVVYYVAVTYLFLLLSTRVLGARRWR